MEGEQIEAWLSLADAMSDEEFAWFLDDTEGMSDEEILEYFAMVSGDPYFGEDDYDSDEDS